jgi:hypothetical protein
MTGVTDDPNHPGVKRGPPDQAPVPQHDTYLVLSEVERAKGFVRPLRRSYRHVGIAGPKYTLRELSQEERARWGDREFAKYEEYPQPNAYGSSAVGRYWTQKELDSIDKGCGVVTTMGVALAETYARDPRFYGATYCCGCQMHRAVGADGEFVWEGTNERVGT